MSSTVRAKLWLTARNLHQIQVLSCDIVDLTVWTADDQCAPYWRIYWHPTGGAELLVERGVISMEPDTLYVIPPGTHFGSRLKKGTRQFFISFMAEPVYGRPHGKIIELPVDRAFRQKCRTIIHTLESDTRSLRPSLLAHHLIADCLLQSPATYWRERYEDTRITKAAERIRRSYPRRLPVEKLAKSASLSAAAFIRLFKAYTGRTPLEYLTGLRIEEACTLLHQSEATIDEITERVGFSDRAYFTRMFSQRMNCPPAYYRNLVNASNRLRP
jgi:AraC-like DNA-binding protein